MVFMIGYENVCQCVYSKIMAVSQEYSQYFIITLYVVYNILSIICKNFGSLDCTPETMIILHINNTLIGIKKDFPGGPVVKDLLCEAGDTGSSLAGELRPARCRAHRPTCFDCRGHTLQLERWPLQRKIRVLQHRAARHSHT